MINKLLFATALMLIGAVSVLVVGFFAYSNKPVPQYHVSVETMNYTQQMVSTRYDGIIAVHISTVDIRKNSKTLIYTHVNDKYSQYLISLDKTRDMQLFTRDNTHNQEIILLINGEVVCDKVENKKIKNKISRCSIGIPPYYGKFYGIIDVYYDRTIGDTEMIKQFLIDISLTTYFADFASK